MGIQTNTFCALSQLIIPGRSSTLFLHLLQGRQCIGKWNMGKH